MRFAAVELVLQAAAAESRELAGVAMKLLLASPGGCWGLSRVYDEVAEDE